MLTVSIAINGVTIMARSAVNTGKTVCPSSRVTKYAVDDGSFVLHDPKDGAVALEIGRAHV